MAEHSSDEDKDKAGFARTRWTLVLAAGQQESRDSKEALAKLCETYWYPLYVYARRRVSSRTEAEDLTQEFFAEFLEKNYVADADPDRGRFRAFLLTAFRNFISKQWDKARTVKRGGDRSFFSLDFDDANSRFGGLPDSSEMTPDQWFNRQWALTLLDRTLKQLEAEQCADGKENLFSELKGFIIGDQSGTTYADVAESLGMTPAAAKMAASRLRSRYQAILRNEIAQTIAENESVEDEIRNLFGALGKN